jgi:hypothetical protein
MRFHIFSNINLLSRDLANLPFRIVTRFDFIGRYVGRTTQKTLALLESSIGGILYINDAHLLVINEQDFFGIEALTIIYQFIRDRSTEIIIIFAGNKTLLDNTIFRF